MRSPSALSQGLEDTTPTSGTQLGLGRGICVRITDSDRHGGWQIIWQFELLGSCPVVVGIPILYLQESDGHEHHGPFSSLWQDSLNCFDRLAFS